MGRITTRHRATSLTEPRVEEEQSGHTRHSSRNSRQKQRISGSLRRQVRTRARGCCEYCLLRDSDGYVPFHADHVIAEKHGGLATFENLAWACGLCNLHKGTDLASIDPDGGALVPLFNPRQDRWKDHFRLVSWRIEPLTPIGRVTVRLLHLNVPERAAEREILILAGRYPTPPG